MESLRASLRQITPIATGRVSALPVDEMNDDHPVKTQVHEEARDSDNEDEDEDEDEDEGEEEDVRGYPLAAVMIHV